MEKEQTQNKNIKNKKIDNKRLVIIVGVILVIVLAVVLCVILGKPNNKHTYNQWEYINSSIDTYNASKKDSLERVILAEPNEGTNDDILFIINGKLNTDATNYTATINYTNKTINTVTYNDKGNIKEIISASIDENYNIKYISLVDSKTAQLYTYTINDKEFKTYEVAVAVVIQRAKEALTSLGSTNINLFNKTLTEIKTTK